MNSFPRAKGPTDLVPYSVLLQNKNWAVRQKVAQELYYSSHPSAPSLLHESLHDPDERVRLCGAQALGLLADQAQKKIQSFRNQLVRTPHDGEAQEGLSDALCEYAQLGMESEQVQRHFYGQAKDILHALLQRRSPPPTINLKLANVLFHLGEYQKARECTSLVDETDGDFLAARFLMAELSFKLRQFDQVAMALEPLRSRRLTDEQKEMVDYWCPTDD